MNLIVILDTLKKEPAKKKNQLSSPIQKKFIILEKH